MVVYYSFSFKKATSLIEPLKPLLDGHFQWWFPTRLSTKCVL